MTLRIRIYIALGFIGAFLLTAPPILFYSSGYRYDWNKKEWFNPGWIILDSTPEKASVFINGRDTGFKTPAAVKDLKPDDYLVEVKLDSYHGWQKRLTVEPGRAAFAKSINLFRISEPKPIEDDWHQWAFSPNQKKFAAFKNKFHQNAKLTIIDSAGVVAMSDQNRISSFLWDNQSKNALVTFGDRLAIYQDGKIKKIDFPGIVFVENLISRGPWLSLDGALFEVDRQILTEQNLLFLKAGDKIVLSNSGDKTLTKITELENPELFHDFYVMGDKIFLIENGNSGKSVYLEIVSDDLGKKIISSFPLARYRFINSPGKFLLILDQENNQLYVIRPPTQIHANSPDLVLPEMIVPAKNAIWDQFGEKLVYYTDYELWVWNAKTGEKNLITRLSDKINWVNWHPGGDYLLYTTDYEIKVIELDRRDKRNVHTLTKIGPEDFGKSKTPGISSAPLISNGGEKIFFIGIDHANRGARTLFEQDI